jgi:GntR family transcriptional regulator/MocR family aminotransferase
LIDDIRRGRLKPGTSLPSSRALAESLDVHRNTVLAAFRELSAEGWIETTPGKGTFVSASMPEMNAPRAVSKMRPNIATRLGFDLAHRASSNTPQLPAVRGTIELSAGKPDVRLLPTDVIARAYRRASRSKDKHLFDYGDPRGDARLRKALSTMLGAVRGVVANDDEVLITRGSQMALDVTARALLCPGDVVAIEALGYRPAWEALGQTGARLVPLPIDDEGLSIDAFEHLIERERVRAVYLTPHHQYPSTALLSPARRLRLLELARTHRIAILEDDYDHEFHYDGRPVLPLASADRSGVVIYIGTLSKILAPGLRIGFVVAPVPFIERLASIRTFIDRQGDHAVERAIAELLEDGEVQRHARRMRRIYQERRDLLVSALRKHLEGAIDFTVPSGGIAMWLRVAQDIDVDDWVERAAKSGLSVHGGRRYAFDGRSRPFLRACFASLNEREIREAVARLAASCPRPTKTRGS